MEIKMKRKPEKRRFYTKTKTIISCKQTVSKNMTVCVQCIQLLIIFFERRKTKREASENIASHDRP